MQPSRPALPFRNDTILGVCEALGEDLRIHPNLLRILFAGLFYFNPLLVTGTYFGLGALVALSRWIFPSQPAALPSDAAADGVANEKTEEFKLAA